MPLKLFVPTPGAPSRRPDTHGKNSPYLVATCSGLSSEGKRPTRTRFVNHRLVHPFRQMSLPSTASTSKAEVVSEQWNPTNWGDPELRSRYFTLQTCPRHRFWSTKGGRILYSVRLVRQVEGKHQFLDTKGNTTRLSDWKFTI